MRCLLALLLCLACAPAKTLPHASPTHDQQSEIDARREDLLACLPSDAVKTRAEPAVRVSGDCYVYTPDGHRARGWTDMRSYIVVPRDLGALAHEYAHWYTRDWTHSGYTASCGDPIDTRFLQTKPHCAKDGTE